MNAAADSLLGTDNGSIYLNNKYLIKLLIVMIIISLMAFKVDTFKELKS